ncbi:hypothetical protein OESDEN_17024 [Oesophagostomum dentatum]|uniref:SCP domain-containing protein n=1 Tax=Oesophagostomum dentatum TaxID=61180 RepID=A0A0B1SD98_OESDE|nr:hypothetical protein OESDEN_17024 [Oesophagostomum dentatum]
MLKMVYDCEVEAEAMKHAKKCEFKHSHGRFGENLFKIGSISIDDANLAIKAFTGSISYRMKRDFGLYSG